MYSERPRSRRRRRVSVSLVFEDTGRHTGNDDLGETQNSTEVDWVIGGLRELSTVNLNHQHSSISLPKLISRERLNRPWLWNCISIIRSWASQRQENDLVFAVWAEHEVSDPLVIDLKFFQALVPLRLRDALSQAPIGMSVEVVFSQNMATHHRLVIKGLV